ncbi:annexin [Myxococcus qinghaiensis]|uniref:annexin n=1 Tax=Myxococcus qinghaiensis TaxID=2906758 RepID=UPI0020A8266C|nr:annexin [Myxococcus qinghaiensis]MCP3166821.1 annexin [Myxococcus qinghaiensis]
MRVNEGGSTRATGTGDSGASSAAAAAERAARAAQLAAEAAARAAAEAARAQAAQAAQAQARAEAAARQAQEALKLAQAALAEAKKKNAPKAELTRAEQAVKQATTFAQQAATSARNAGNRATHASSFVPANTPQVPAQRQTPAGPPGVTPGYTREQAAKDATELYRATKGGLTGWGTDEAAIFKTLDKRTPGDIALIRQSFREHYKEDLDSVLRKELGGDELTRVNNILSGNKGNASAAAIQEQTGFFGDKDAIVNTLRDASPTERQAIARSFQQMYGKDHPNLRAATPEEFMKQALGPRLDAAQRTQLNSLLDTTRASTPEQVTQLEAGAARSKVHDALQGFFGADSDKVFDTLKNLPPEQKKVLLADAALQSELRGKLSKEDYARARGLMEDNPAAASAAQINSATQGWFGADESAILDVLKSTKPEDMPALKAEFQKQTGRSLESEVKGWGGADTQVGLRYLNPPAANDTLGQAQAAAEQLHRAMDGAGTDEAALREVLGDKSKTQINDITAAYRDLYKRDLRSDLTSELGGRDKFEIVDQMYDLGAIDPKAPDAAKQQVDRLRAQQQFEQSGGLGIIDTLQNVTKGESDSERLERNLTAAETAISTGDTAAAQRRTTYATDDVKDLQETKDSTADMAATAAVAVVTTAAVVATGGAATPLAIAGYAALGATTRVATQAYFKGDSLGMDGVAQQAVVGAVEGGTVVIPLPKGLGGAGATAATETVEQVAKQTVGQRLRSTAIQGAWEGGVGGALGGATDQSLQSETWKNGLLPGLQQVGQRAVVDGTVGTVFGAGGGVAMDGVMQGASRLTTPREVPVLTNPALDGGTVHVRYGEGRVRIEAGPNATPAQIQAHMETARTLQKYEGPLGQVRQLKDRVNQALTGQPGYGTQGFESQLEVKKLNAIIKDLEAVQQRIDTRLQKLNGSGQAPTAAQREVMEREIADLRSQLDTHAAQVGSLAPARGYVAAEQLSKGKTEALNRGYPTTEAEGLPKDHFWVENENGQLYLQRNSVESGPRKLYEPSGREAEGVFGDFTDAPLGYIEPKFPAGVTREEAFDALGGNNPKSPFGAWVKSLEAEGLIKDKQELVGMLRESPGGLSFGTVRHELKDQYSDQLLSRMTDPARLRATPAYAEALKVTQNPEQALVAASHTEMLRITRELGPADKGALAQRWYQSTFESTRKGVTEVSVSKQAAADLGITFTGDRRIDVLEPGTVRELKNVSTRFGEREHDQLMDLVKLYGKTLDGTDTPIEQVVETFVDPRGVVANSKFLHDMFDGSGGQYLKVEVFKADGTTLVIDANNRGILNQSQAELEKTLGITK